MLSLNKLDRYKNVKITFRSGRTIVADIVRNTDKSMFSDTHPFFIDGCLGDIGDVYTSDGLWSTRGEESEYDIIRIELPQLEIPETLQLKDYNTLQWLYDNFEEIDETHYIIHSEVRDLHLAIFKLKEGGLPLLRWMQYNCIPKAAVFPSQSSVIFVSKSRKRKPKSKNHINSSGVGLSRPSPSVCCWC